MAYSSLLLFPYFVIRNMKPSGHKSVVNIENVHVKFLEVFFNNMLGISSELS